MARKTEELSGIGREQLHRIVWSLEKMSPWGAQSEDQLAQTFKGCLRCWFLPFQALQGRFCGNPMYEDLAQREVHGEPQRSRGAEGREW